VTGPKQKKHGQNKKTKFKKLSMVRYIILKIKIRFIFSLNPFFISKYPGVLWHGQTPYACARSLQQEKKISNICGKQ
jgi:hypothetical protein